MYAHTNPQTKEELIRQVEAGEGVYATDPRAIVAGSGQTEGETTIYGPPAWIAKVQLNRGQIVKVLS